VRRKRWSKVAASAASEAPLERVRIFLHIWQAGDSVSLGFQSTKYDNQCDDRVMMMMLVLEMEVVVAVIMMLLMLLVMMCYDRRRH
jgi:hypothetical protein